MADIATVHIGFIAYGPDSDCAYATGSRVSNAIIDAAHRRGRLPKKPSRAKTRASPPCRTTRSTSSPPPRGPSASSRSPRAGPSAPTPTTPRKVLDVAVKAGANQSGQIEWSLKDENAPQAQAAAKALKRARTVAGQMAAGLNVKARRPPLRQQRDPGRTRPAPDADAMGVAAHGSTAARPPLAINPRRIEKSATVYAVFAIE